ncbi:MAG: SRPBCC family protein [Ramlibacter sp.]
MIKAIAITAAAALGALLIYAATRPDVFRVQRSATINAPADRIYPLVNDLRAFNTWNPFNKKDPSMKLDYRGPAAGAGAAFDFNGNKDVGRGSIQITDSAAPSRVAMKLDMIEPFEGHNDIEFTLIPRGNATEVNWAMHGPSPYIAKLMGIFFNMDSMIGKDFEAGLSGLKTRAEQRSAT